MTYAIRKCPGCGYARRVRVRDWYEPGGSSHGLSHAYRCKACDYVLSAQIHERWAVRNRRTAARLYAEQDARAAKRAAKEKEKTP